MILILFYDPFLDFLALLLFWEEEGLLVKIQYAGDLHVEFGGTPIQRIDLVGDVLVLAGDIAGSPGGLVEYIDRLHANIPIVYVLGNHEHYSNSWDKVLELNH